MYVVVGCQHTPQLLYVPVRSLRPSVQFERTHILALERRGLLRLAQEAVAESEAVDIRAQEAAMDVPRGADDMGSPRRCARALGYGEQRRAKGRAGGQHRTLSAARISLVRRHGSRRRPPRATRDRHPQPGHPARQRRRRPARRRRTLDDHRPHSARRVVLTLAALVVGCVTRPDYRYGIPAPEGDNATTNGPREYKDAESADNAGIQQGEHRC